MKEINKVEISTHHKQKAKEIADLAIEIAQYLYNLGEGADTPYVHFSDALQVGATIASTMWARTGSLQPWGDVEAGVVSG